MDCLNPFFSSENNLLCPCGQCIICKTRRKNEWIMRMQHEDLYMKYGIFLTLTYAPAHLPPDNSLCYDDFQRFMKRLRKRFPGVLFRYFVAGEYGSSLKSLRPHWHLILWFDQPVDFRPVPVTQFSNDLRRQSLVINELWPAGFNTVGTVTTESISYVAGYVTKKIISDSEWKRTFPLLRPQFTKCSQGLGRQWMYDHAKELRNNLFIMKGSHKVGIPRYYRDKLGITKDDFDLVSFEMLNLQKYMSETGKSAVVDASHYGGLLYAKKWSKHEYIFMENVKKFVSEDYRAWLHSRSVSSASRILSYLALKCRKKGVPVDDYIIRKQQDLLKHQSPPKLPNMSSVSKISSELFPLDDLVQQSLAQG